LHAWRSSFFESQSLFLSAKAGVQWLAAAFPGQLAAAVKEPRSQSPNPLMLNQSTN
jgi:hypothetical protein